MLPQLRQDLLSNEWVCIAPKRIKRANFLIKVNKNPKISKKGCPFENPLKSGNKVLLKNKEIQIIENKFPAFSLKNYCPLKEKRGPYQILDALGRHELLIIKDHFKNLSQLSPKQIFFVLKVLKERILSFKKDCCIEYVSIFQNWGEKAGASVYHPHFQIIATPIIPPFVSNLINIAKKYYIKNKKCLHCYLLNWEKKEKQRIIYENEGAIVIAPFASKEPFEFRIFPKKHIVSFEETSEKDLAYISDALKHSLQKMAKNLKDPDYNLHIRTTPLKKNKKYDYYHWYIEVITRLTIAAGFEENSRIEINPIDPIETTKILRK